MLDDKLKNPPKSLFNDEAIVFYKFLVEELEGMQIKNIDQELLVNLSNLRSQKIELEKEIRENGYTVVNVNARGGKTYQTNPAYRAYISAIAEMTKIMARLGMSPKDRSRLDFDIEETDDFDECFD